MTPELERLVEECNVALRQFGYEINELRNVTTEEKIGTPKPPRK